MIEDIEVKNIPFESLSLVDFQQEKNSLFSPNRKKDRVYLFKKNKKTFLVSPYELEGITLQEASQYTVFSLSSKKCQKLYQDGIISIRLGSFVSRFDDVLDATYSEGMLQYGYTFLGETTSINNTFDVNAQIGLPLILSFISTALRIFLILETYKNKHGVEAPPEIRKEIIKDCVIYGIRIAVSMGCWEFSLFKGLLTFLNVLPSAGYLLLIAAVFQGIQAIISQIAFEKIKYGRCKSSGFELAKLFIDSFIGAIVWQLINTLPFGELLVSELLEPLASFSGAMLACLASAITSFVIHKTVPWLLDEGKHAVTFFAKEKNVYSKEALMEEEKEEIVIEEGAVEGNLKT